MPNDRNPAKSWKPSTVILIGCNLLSGFRSCTGGFVNGKCSCSAPLKHARPSIFALLFLFTHVDVRVNDHQNESPLIKYPERSSKPEPPGLIQPHEIKLKPDSNHQNPGKSPTTESQRQTCDLHWHCPQSGEWELPAEFRDSDHTGVDDQRGDECQELLRKGAFGSAKGVGCHREGESETADGCW